MELGIFVVPFRRLTTSLKDGFEFDLDLVAWAEQFGYSEAWFAEHYTIAHENGPAPDIAIAAASRHTNTIRLGAAAHLLPYHNPIALAHRIMLLDHITEGRYMCGVATGAFPTDKQLFATDDNSAMMEEALTIMKAIWTADGEPFRIDGKYWTVDYPAYDEFWAGPGNIRPYQKPHPPIAMAGVSAESSSMKRAGAAGYIPISEPLHFSYQANHWRTYSAAALDAGLIPDRSMWRVCQWVFVADSDEEARRLARTSGFYSGADWTVQVLKRFELGHLLLPPDDGDREIQTDYLIDNVWPVGSPETVAARLEEVWETLGGFGNLMVFTYDDVDDPEPARQSMQLLAEEVVPRLRHLEFAVPEPV